MTYSHPRSGRDTRSRGRAGEAVAQRYLRRQGYEILHKNYWTRHGEIDLVVWDPKEDYLLFVEVKAYQTDNIDPRTVIRADKQRHLWRTAQRFLLQFPKYQDTNCRFDLIIVKDSAVNEHMKHVLTG